jgi:hypothetical protein
MFCIKLLVVVDGAVPTRLGSAYRSDTAALWIHVEPSP